MQAIEPQIYTIPYTEFINIMNKRQYDIQYIIKYTATIYQIDILQIYHFSKNIINNLWGENIYIDFLQDYPELEVDNKSRQHFNNCVKPRYVKFYNKYFSPKYNVKLDDMLIPNPTKANVIHHIHPLIFGGTNDFYNLLPVTDFNHKLLHMNPYENNLIACFKAVDMLAYLYSKQMIKILYKKYFTKKIKDKGYRFQNRMWQIIFEEEMQNFYNNIIC